MLVKLTYYPSAETRGLSLRNGSRNLHVKFEYHFFGPQGTHNIIEGSKCNFFQKYGKLETL